MKTVEAKIETETLVRFRCPNCKRLHILSSSDEDQSCREAVTALSKGGFEVRINYCKCKHIFGVKA